MKNLVIDTLVFLVVVCIVLPYLMTLLAWDWMTGKLNQGTTYA